MITLIFEIIAIVVIATFRVTAWIVRIIWEVLRLVFGVFFWAGFFLLFKGNRH